MLNSAVAAFAMYPWYSSSFLPHEGRSINNAQRLGKTWQSVTISFGRNFWAFSGRLSGSVSRHDSWNRHHK